MQFWVRSSCTLLRLCVLTMVFGSRHFRLIRLRFSVGVWTFILLVWLLLWEHSLSVHSHAVHSCLVFFFFFFERLVYVFICSSVVVFIVLRGLCFSSAAHFHVMFCVDMQSVRALVNCMFMSWLCFVCFYVPRTLRLTPLFWLPIGLFAPPSLPCLPPDFHPYLFFPSAMFFPYRVFFIYYYFNKSP